MIENTQLFELFFQKNKEYYLDKLTRYRNGQKFTFNPFAFLFGLLWFAYRKMYLQAFVIFIVILVEGFLEQLILPNTVQQSASNFINIFTTIIIGTVTGFLGNNLYIQQAERIIASTQAKYKDTEEIQKQIKHKGGVSYLLFFLIALISILFFIYNNYVTKNSS